MCEKRTVKINKYHFKLPFIHLVIESVIHERNLVRRESAYKNTGNEDVRGRSKNRHEKEKERSMKELGVRLRDKESGQEED